MTAVPGRWDERRPRVRLALGFLAVGLLLSVTADGLETAPGDLESAEALYRRYCAVCHGPGGRGDGPNAAFLEDDRPRDLTDARYLGALSDDHLARVIREGGQALRGSRFMPPWGRTLSPSQMRALVAYIRTLSARPPELPDPPAGPPVGATLARELGCPTCHRMPDLPPSPVGPDLGSEGSRVQRTWLIRFLQAPHTIRPVGYHPLSRSRMPDFRLSEEEAVRLADYLLTQRHERLEDRPDSMPAADLTGRGRDLFRQYACRACHSRDGSGGRAGPDLSSVASRLKPGWVMRFLQDPQAVDPLSPMPHLGVEDEAARAITSYLFDAVFPPPERPPSAEAARRGLSLFKGLGCAGCHRGARDGRGEHVGPDLSAVGDKLRPEWMEEFLTQPFTIRPGRMARMPTFRLKEAESRLLTEFLASLREPAASPLAERLRFQGTLAEANVQAGRQLASREFLSCASCHVGEEQPEGPPEEWAPDLRISGQRLNPDWIVRWLQDPQRLEPGTKMPTFFLDETSGPEEILDGDEAHQILALRDYLLSLGGISAGEFR